MKPDMVVLTPPNDAPRMEAVYVFVSRDAEGREDVCGSLLGSMGTQPLMTGNPRVLELMLRLAQQIAKQVEGTDRTIHLLKFSVREEITGWR